MKLELKQNTPEWLEARKKYRTASEAAIVCGVSPFTSKEDFKLIKAGLKTQYYSKAMQRGHELEDTVRQWASERLGVQLEEACFVSGDYMASLDAYSPEQLSGAPCPGVIVEIKASKWTYDDIKNGKIPEYYALQMQQQMYCAKVDFAYLAAIHPDTGEMIMSEPYFYDAAAMQRIGESWESFDAMETPKVADLSDNGKLAELFGEYAALKAEADHIKDKLDAIKAELITYGNGLKTVTCNDFKLTQSSPRVSYDYKKACEDAQLVLDEYKKTGKPSWVVTVPKSPFDKV